MEKMDCDLLEEKRRVVVDIVKKVVEKKRNPELKTSKYIQGFIKKQNRNKKKIHIIGLLKITPPKQHTSRTKHQSNRKTKKLSIIFEGSYTKKKCTYKYANIMEFKEDWIRDTC